MRKYYITGKYPDGHLFSCNVEVDDKYDAIAIAQGLRKVTTINEVTVTSSIDCRVVFHDCLRR